jgi:hypothetical protein
MSSNAAAMLVKPSAPAAAKSNRRNGVGGASSDSSSESTNETCAAFSTSVVGAFLPLDPRVGRFGRFVAPHHRASSPVSALSPELRARRERADSTLPTSTASRNL